jgi:hypothetical protein
LAVNYDIAASLPSDGVTMISVAWLGAKKPLCIYCVFLELKSPTSSEKEPDERLQKSSALPSLPEAARFAGPYSPQQVRAK